MATPITRTVVLNGTTHTISVDDDREQLLYVLRNALGQRGPKFGCGVSQCGACTVLVDDAIRRSCVVPLSTVAEGATIETLDGIGTADAPHPLQQAFLDEQAAQCAYCVNGMIMGALGWLRARAAAGNTALPTDDEIKAFLSGGTEDTDPVLRAPLQYLCRCGTHQRIVKAIGAAAQEMLS